MSESQNTQDDAGGRRSFGRGSVVHTDKFVFGFCYSDSPTAVHLLQASDCQLFDLSSYSFELRLKDTVIHSSFNFECLI